MIKRLLTLAGFFSPPRDTTKLSHAKLRLGNPQTISAGLCQHQKGRQSLLSGTPIFAAGHINLLVTQAMQVDENECLVA